MVKKVRNYLTPEEVNKIIECSREFSHMPERDVALWHIMYKYGLRCTEVANLTWDQINLKRREIYIKRAKGNNDMLFDNMTDKDIAVLTDLKNYYIERGGKFMESPYVFLSQNGKKLSQPAFYVMLNKVGELAEIEVNYPNSQSAKLNPHMFRHGFGYRMINAPKPPHIVKIAAWMGHKNINTTYKYTALSKSAMDELNSIW